MTTMVKLAALSSVGRKRNLDSADQSRPTKDATPVCVCVFLLDGPVNVFGDIN